MELNANESYEIKAEAFHIMTSMMAPGKDAGMLAMGLPYEDRLERWRLWLEEHGTVINAFLSAAQRVL